MGLGREYLEVVLRLGRLVPGWVESYVGPPALARGVDAGEDITANELRKSVEALSERVSAEVKERERRAWLLVQLGAISTALFWFEGERLGYEELFLACHGAEVELVPERCFEEAHSLLDQALPGHGDVAVRYRAWRDGTLVPRERLGQALELLADSRNTNVWHGLSEKYATELTFEQSMSVALRCAVTTTGRTSALTYG